MRRFSWLIVVGTVGLIPLAGCGGSTLVVKTLEDATFLPNVIRSTVGTTTVLSRVNSSGKAIGSTVLAGPQLRAVSWTGTGGVDLIARPSGMIQSTANDINGSGVIIGKCIDGSLQEFPMIVNGVTATVLNWTVIGATGEAQVVNDAGVIGGVTYGSPSNRMVRQNTDNTLTNIGGLRAGVFRAINAAGTMIGQFQLNDAGDISGFVASGATITPFSVVGATITAPKDINASGEIVGREGGENVLGRPWYRSSGGVITFLPFPTGYTNGWATCINDAGVIGGYVAQPDGSSPRAVIWVNREPILLNSRTTLTGGGVLTFVQDINVNNQVLATVQEGSNSFPCLLTPQF